MKMETKSRTSTTSGLRSKEKLKIPSRNPESCVRPVGITLTAHGLRELWNFDNEMARKYMGGPWRTCSALQDVPMEPGAADKLQFWKGRIEAMWKKAAEDFEIFDDEYSGYGLRVRICSTAMKAIITPLEFGWIAVIAKEVVEASGDWNHVYNRSSMTPLAVDKKDPNYLEYLGGPISYLNFIPQSKSKVDVGTTKEHTIATITLDVPFSAGSELKWNYGAGNCKVVPDLGKWFYSESCCKVVKKERLPGEIRRHNLKGSLKEHWYKDQCVLCGKEYSIENKDKRTQRKPHLLGSHADYFEVGIDRYIDQEVDSDKVLLDAEKLNQMLMTLKAMNWQVMPACNIFTPADLLKYDTSEKIMAKFNEIKPWLVKSGVICLSGEHVPTEMRHFIKRTVRNWKAINWKYNRRLEGRKYSVKNKRSIESIKSELPKTVGALLSSWKGELPS